ncbi:MAG: SDR family oxidoreductase [Balneolaceae bacterium]
MSLFSLKDKTAVVTGASRGIGKSIAILFARQGADVHILDLDQPEGEDVVEQISAGGGKATFHQLDVTDQQAVLKAFNNVFQHRERLDILVNNAGRAHIGKLEETTEEDFDSVYAVNVKGVYNCSYAAVDRMKRSGGGVILNMASIVAGLGIADRFAYSMSKGAVLSMTYSIAKDYLEANIRCNAVSPARVHTPFVDGYLKNNYPGQEKEMFEKLSGTQPIGRMGRPEEIAWLALYLCSDEAGFTTGTNYPIDGGFIKLNT